MKNKLQSILQVSLTFLLVLVTTIHTYAQDEQVKEEILAHGALIREAFANEDIEKIRYLHHPEVIKALGYEDLKIGREAVIQALDETLQNFKLAFIKNEVESLLIEGNIAIEQTKFSIQGTPKNGGDAFVFSGRTLVTYIKSEESPSGWATIREIIQPAN